MLASIKAIGKCRHIVRWRFAAMQINSQWRTWIVVSDTYTDRSRGARSGGYSDGPVALGNRSIVCHEARRAEHGDSPAHGGVAAHLLNPLAAGTADSNGARYRATASQPAARQAVSIRQECQLALYIRRSHEKPRSRFTIN